MPSIETRHTQSGPRYRVVWREDGKKQQQTYGTLTDAQRFADRVRGAGERWPAGEDPRKQIRPGAVTLSVWAEQAIESRARANERTKADYRRDFAAHLEPLLGHLLLDQVTAAHVAEWVADRQAAHLSDKTIRNLHGFASSLFNDALHHRPPLVDHNPFEKRLGKLAQVRTEEMTFLTPQEFATVLGHVREEYRPLVRVLYGTGMRFGEATALTVRDIDLFGQRKTATITKAWKRTGPAQWEIGEPKTQRSRRTITLSPELVDVLIPLVSAKRGDDLVFCGRFGERVPHIDVYKRGWAPAVARANVCGEHYEPQRDGRGQRPRLPVPCGCAGTLDKSPRIHDLRHSHASWLIAQGVPLAAISRRLGHSSITITVDRYGHLDPSLDAQVDAAVSRAFSPSGSPAAAPAT